ncbi:MAG TPA: vitamin K epoxide reductase family protein [Candidatus Limnocylindrales bacterium]|jgi:uncharacterized membrane protein
MTQQGSSGIATVPSILLALAIIGAAIAGYLTAFQLGLIGDVWDPLFGSGSERVLTSPVSRLLPVPDASLGVVAYVVDAILALAIVLTLGPLQRLRQILAVVAGLGALGSVVLVVLQPLIAQAFCSLCLASAAISIALAIGAVSEASAPTQEVHR